MEERVTSENRREPSFSGKVGSRVKAPIEPDRERILTTPANFLILIFILQRTKQNKQQQNRKNRLTLKAQRDDRGPAYYVITPLIAPKRSRLLR